MPTYDLYPAVNEDYELAPEVREANALTPEFRNQVVPMTETQRNNLTGDQLWTHRMVFNTTTLRVNRYTGSAWVDLNVEGAGIIKLDAGAVPPSNHLLCNGAVVSRSGIYAALFARIGTQYNIGGEASTDFRIPNLKGRVPVGLDAGQAEFNVLGETGGEKTHTLTEAETPAHDHAGTTGAENATHVHPVDPDDVVAHQHNLPLADQSVQSGTGATVQKWTATPAQTSSGGGSQILGASVGTESAGHGHPFATDTAGGGGAHNNLQPYIALNYIITL